MNNNNIKISLFNSNRNNQEIMIRWNFIMKTKKDKSKNANRKNNRNKTRKLNSIKVFQLLKLIIENSDN